MRADASGWAAAVRGLAAAHVEERRRRWTEGGGTVHRAVDEILAGPTPLVAPVAEAVARARAALAVDPAWLRLSQALGVAGRDAEWLALLVACELDPRLQFVLGYLDDASAPAPPTPAAGARLWGWPVGGMPGSVSTLATWRLAGPDGDWHSTTPWSADPEIAAYLAGDPSWLGIHGTARPFDVDSVECLHPALRDRMASALADAGPAVAELAGRPGSGRRTLLAQVAVALGRTPLLVAPDAGVAGLRAARLLDAVPIQVADAGEDAPADPGALSLVACEQASAAPRSAARLAWDLPPVSAAQRHGLWADVRADAPPAIVAEWELTPAEVATAAAAGPAAGEVLATRLRARSTSIMQPMPQPYGWDDLVVAGHVADALHRLVDRVLLRRDVLDEWGFGRLMPGSAGTTALFAGPSGTGKTMATQVVARALGLDLFRVDLARVVSKYIGETEKHLARVFDEAERTRMVVLFDEADALFGQRTAVQDAHDRYANIEIDYLLQRLDGFGGVAILATNRKGDLDPAFLRRLGAVVDFVAPAPAERLRLWQATLPAESAAGARITDGVDHAWLAANLELTGAEITLVAVGAAYEARRAGGLVTLDLVLDACRRELGKRGAVLRVAAPAVAAAVPDASPGAVARPAAARAGGGAPTRRAAAR